MSDYKETRSSQIRKTIQNIILECIDNGKNRIPPEMELANKLLVSRTMIRDCLDVLEQEGYINRVHGVGTIINKDISRTQSRLDTNVDLFKMVENVGMKPSVISSDYSYLYADEDKAKKLNVRETATLIQISQVIGANGVPVIYCRDYIVDDSKNHGILFANKRLKSVYQLLEKLGKNKIHMDIAELGATLSDDEVSEKLKIKRNTPLVLSKEVGYDIYGNPILYSEDYFREEILKHKVIHKKII